MTSTTVMDHRELSDPKVSEVNDLLKSVNQTTHVQSLLKTNKLIWKLEPNPSDPDAPIIRPVLVERKTGKEQDTGSWLTLMFPPVEMSFLRVGAENIIKYSDGLESAAITLKPRSYEDADEDCRKRYKDYYDSVQELKLFFHRDLAAFLVENLDKHAYFSPKQMLTLQKLKQSNTNKANEKVLEWIEDDQNKSIYEYKIGVGKKKMFGFIGQGEQNIEKADLYDGSGQLSAWLKENPEKKFQMCQIFRPDGSELPLNEFKTINDEKGIFSLTIGVGRLNKSKYAGGGLSIISALSRCQVIVNGKPYGSSGVSTTNAVNVFDVLNNTSSSSAATPVAINLTATMPEHKASSDMREQLKKRGGKGMHSDQPKKRNKIKSDPTVVSDEE